MNIILSVEFILDFKKIKFLVYNVQNKVNKAKPGWCLGWAEQDPILYLIYTLQIGNHTFKECENGKKMHDVVHF